MYTILEMQTTGGVTTCNPPQYQDTKEKAMSVYHGILQYAAISNVEYHTVVVLTETGQYIARECYEHPALVEAPVEPEESVDGEQES